jgi:hypothetical protein
LAQLPARLLEPLVAPTKTPPWAGMSATAWQEVQPEALLPPTQISPLQTSLLVHTLLSVQAALLAACKHPRFESQMSSVHGLLSLQFIGDPLPHMPLLQVSPTVQAFASLQGSALFW